MNAAILSTLRRRRQHASTYVWLDRASTWANQRRGLRRKPHLRVVDVEEIDQQRRPGIFKPDVYIPPLIRARDLAKLLKVPVEAVVLEHCRRERRKFLFDDYESGKTVVFASIKEIILPFKHSSRVAKALKGQQAAMLHPADELVLRYKHLEKDGIKAPVILVMGHVDHGKTTLVDVFRGPERDRIAPSETHGITQRINISNVQIPSLGPCIVLDTPGHEQFFAMRSVCSEVADLCVLVVAADEGCRQQTGECIGWLEDVKIPTVVGLNKIDAASSESINTAIESVREFEYLDKAVVVPISAKKKLHIPQLQKEIANAAASLDLSVNISGPAVGSVLEVYMARGAGLTLEVLIEQGTLRKKDHIVAGMIRGSIKTLQDESGQVVDAVPPGKVARVTISFASKTRDLPVGQKLIACDAKASEKVTEQRLLQIEYEDLCSRAIELPAELPRPTASVSRQKTATGLGEKGRRETRKENQHLSPAEERRRYNAMIPVIIKADTVGALQTLFDGVRELPNVKIIRQGIGDVHCNDIFASSHHNDIIVGFGVSMQRTAKDLKETRRKTILLHDNLPELVQHMEQIVAQKAKDKPPAKWDDEEDDEDDKDER